MHRIKALVFHQNRLQVPFSNDIATRLGPLFLLRQAWRKFHARKTNAVKFQSRRTIARAAGDRRHRHKTLRFFFQLVSHVRSGCRRRRGHGSGPVSPRRIASRAIGKKVGFPIEFIRLTSVDSVAPAMAGTNGTHRVACSRGQRDFRYGVELPVTTLRARLNREETDSICVCSRSVGIGDRLHPDSLAHTRAFIALPSVRWIRGLARIIFENSS